MSPMRSLGRSSMKRAISILAVSMRFFSDPRWISVATCASDTVDGASMADMLGERSTAIMMSMPSALDRISSMPSRGCATATIMAAPPMANSTNGMSFRQFTRRAPPAARRNGARPGTRMEGARNVQPMKRMAAYGMKRRSSQGYSSFICGLRSWKKARIRPGWCRK